MNRDYFRVYMMKLNENKIRKSVETIDKNINNNLSRGNFGLFPWTGHLSNLSAA